MSNRTIQEPDAASLYKLSLAIGDKVKEQFEREKPETTEGLRVIVSYWAMELMRDALHPTPPYERTP